MAVIQELRALGGNGNGIGTKADPGLLYRLTYHVLGLVEVHGTNTGAVGNDKVHGGFLRAEAALVSDLCQGFTGQVFQIGIAELHQHHRFGTGTGQPVIPLVRVLAHLPGESLPCLRVLHTFNPLVDTPGLDPGRHDGIQSRGARGIGIHIRGDAQALGARGFNALQHLTETRPGRRMGYLQVIDLCGDGGLPGNGDEFFQGRKYLFALVAQVGGVNAAVLRSRAG